MVNTMLETLLTSIGAPILSALVGSPLKVVGRHVLEAIADALGLEPNEEHVIDKIQNERETVLPIIQQLEDTRKTEWVRLQRIAHEISLKEVNETMRQEILNGDRFQRWARPCCMYAVPIVTLLYAIFLCVSGTVALYSRTPQETKIFELIIEFAPSILLILTPCGAVAGVAHWGERTRVHTSNK